MTPDRDITRRFWEGMCARYGTRVVDKQRAIEMRAAGALLQAIGVMPRDIFMERYTTVWGRRIYPCFQVGQGDEDALWSQIVVCVHEHQHVEQFEREGFLPYTLSYLTSSRKRALYEAEAYGCNLEMSWLRTSRMPDLDRMAAKLLDYGCDVEDVRAARAHFEHIAHRITQGTYRSAAVESAIEVLPELFLDGV